MYLRFDSDSVMLQQRLESLLCIFVRECNSGQEPAALGGKCQPHSGHFVQSSWSCIESGTDAELAR